MPKEQFLGDCIKEGCDGKDPLEEEKDIVSELESLSRRLPYLINLLATIDSEKAKEVSSALIEILQETQIESYRISGLRIIQNSRSK
jgi:hypothetical protein